MCSSVGHQQTRLVASKGEGRWAIWESYYDCTCDKEESAERYEAVLGFPEPRVISLGSVESAHAQRFGEGHSSASGKRFLGLASSRQ